MTNIYLLHSYPALLQPNSRLKEAYKSINPKNTMYIKLIKKQKSQKLKQRILLIIKLRGGSLYIYIF